MRGRDREGEGIEREKGIEKERKRGRREIKFT
jgi:hypothetical protein